MERHHRSSRPSSTKDRSWVQSFFSRGKGKKKRRPPSLLGRARKNKGIRKPLVPKFPSNERDKESVLRLDPKDNENGIAIIGGLHSSNETRNHRGQRRGHKQDHSNHQVFEKKLNSDEHDKTDEESMSSRSQDNSRSSRQRRSKSRDRHSHHRRQHSHRRTRHKKRHRDNEKDDSSTIVSKGTTDQQYENCNPVGKLEAITVTAVEFVLKRMHNILTVPCGIERDVDIFGLDEQNQEQQYDDIELTLDDTLTLEGTIDDEQRSYNDETATLSTKDDEDVSVDELDKKVKRKDYTTTPPYHEIKSKLAQEIHFRKFPKLSIKKDPAMYEASKTLEINQTMEKLPNMVVV